MQGFGADSPDFGADLIMIDSKATPAGIFSPTPTPARCKICCVTHDTHACPIRSNTFRGKKKKQHALTVVLTAGVKYADGGEDLAPTAATGKTNCKKLWSF